MQRGLSGGPTQDEVAAVALWHLRIAPGCTVADVGCGTGKIAVAAAGTAGRVIAIDRRSEAAAVARQSAAEASAANVAVICGEAAGVLERFEGPIDAAFVGGSRDLDAVLTVLAGKVKGRIVVDCVLLGTLHSAVETMQRLGIFREVVSLQVARSRPLGSGLMMAPANPVWLVIGEAA